MSATVDACALTTAAPARFDQRLAVRSEDTGSVLVLHGISVRMIEVCQF